MAIQVAQVICATRAEGPGLRMCLQVQGCSIRCCGCAVPETWSAASGMKMEVDELLSLIAGNSDIEGVTLLGGEPFDQAGELAILGTRVKQKGLSVVTFTGYTIEELHDIGSPDHLALLRTTDLLIDGPFRRDQVDFSRPWVGSRNQRFHFLTDRYRQLERDLERTTNRVEVRFSLDGRIKINGMVDPTVLRSLVE